MHGVVDTGADVTIMGGEMFKRVVQGILQPHKRDFKPADKTPHNYDWKPFRLDGWLELDVTFQDCTMKTTIYIKVDDPEPEPLLLSEGVCHLLGFVTYHHDVLATSPNGAAECRVPMVRVKLVCGVRLPLRPDQTVVADVKWD